MGCSRIGRLAATALVALAAAPAAVAASGSVAFQMNPGHTGTIDGAGVEPPLQVRWVTDLPVTEEYNNQGLSYPLIADGRVFVTSRGVDPDYTPSLFALDAATGTVVWSRAVPGRRWLNPAYENGRVFALNDSGRIQAFDAASGALLWDKVLPGDLRWSGSPPVAVDGQIYASTITSTGGVYAIRESDGGLTWFSSLPNVSNGSVAVDSERVYVGDGYASYALRRDNGQIVWRSPSSGSMEGGPGEGTYAVRDGRVYSRYYFAGQILGASDGAALGSFPEGRAVAVTPAIGFFQTWPPLSEGGTLYARSVPGGTDLWSFSGDGALTISPVVVDDRVYTGSAGGWLFALDPASGAPIWCTNVGRGLPVPDEHNYSTPVAGFGAGEGLLLVPSGRSLVAYESGGSGGCPSSAGPGPLASSQPATTPPGSAPTGTSPPGGPAITLRADHTRRRYGQAVILSGTLTGAGLAAGQRLRLEGDAWPYDRFKPIAQTMTGSGGTFRFRTLPSRNIRYRVISETEAAATSRTVQVFTDVAVLMRPLPRPGNRFREQVLISGPRDMRLGGRTLHFYTAAAGSKSVRHSGAAKLKRVRAGRFSAQTMLRAIGSRRRTVVVVCIRERKPDAWGRANPLDPKCGARRLPIPV